MPELLWHNLKSRELKAMAEQDAIIIVNLGSGNLEPLKNIAGDFGNPIVHEQGTNPAN